MEELRKRLTELLTKSQAHMDFDEAVAHFPPDQFNTIFPHGTYSAWHLLEHIRLTQADILEFILNKPYQEKDWPQAYWPSPQTTATPAMWRNTLRQYHADLSQLVDLVNDPEIDLTAIVPNGTDQTYLREFLTVADHTAYHLGEFGIMRQVMKTWGKL